jgi:phasin family protein
MATINRAEAPVASMFPSFKAFTSAFPVPAFGKLPAFDAARFTQGLQAFKVPGFDFDAVQGIQRRNIEALNAANRTLMQGVQTIVQRQGEIARQSVEQFRGLLTAAPSGAPAARIDLVKAAFEKNAADVRELQTIAAGVTSEAADILSRRVAAGLDEVKAAASSKAAGHSAPVAQLRAA